MGRERKHKGTSLLAVVTGLQAQPQDRVRAALAPSLHHYLQGSVLATGWYPEEDYNALIQALADVVDPDLLPDDPWTVFGSIGAMRDVAADQEQLPEEVRTRSTGIYRRFHLGVGAGPYELFKHASALWGLYHDSGCMTFYRDPNRDRAVRGLLEDFPMPHVGFLRLNQGYLLTYADRCGVPITAGDLVFGGPRGHRPHIFEYLVEDTPEARQSLSSMPALPPATPG